MSMAEFQNRTADWLHQCFENSISTCKKERVQRFLEEALELAQAEGMTRDDVELMCNYVYSRPVGDSLQEVGGVMVTLAALCWNANIDLEYAAFSELNRVEEPETMKRIRDKQKAKTAILGITSANY